MASVAGTAPRGAQSQSASALSLQSPQEPTLGDLAEQVPAFPLIPPTSHHAAHQGRGCIGGREDWLTLHALPQAAQHPQQGGLAGARVACDEQTLPLTDFQAQVLDEGLVRGGGKDGNPVKQESRV